MPALISLSNTQAMIFNHVLGRVERTDHPQIFIDDDIVRCTYAPRPFDSVVFTLPTYFEVNYR
jgi:hypothetical protein